jgi:LuxR family maltose regulon positive regulatory protein
LIMADRRQALPIIHTKLHRPPVAGDFVSRKALCDRLDDSGHQPLTLVSAPAGYGKTTLISHWLETREGPSAWLSLDEMDSDIRIFLSYIVATVQSVFPEACAETQAQLEAQELAPLPLLAGCLSNDFDDLEESLVLVLDDYHRINEPAVHELVNPLLLHPTPQLQLVVISHRDPPLSLGSLRAHNSVAEIRMQDLKFTLAETAAFLEETTGQTVSSTAIARLQQITEGWVTGLRLATLALRHRSDVDAFLRGLRGGGRAVQDYLAEEILAKQLSAARDCLCQTSILNRFCAPLCSAVCMAQCNAGEQTLCGTNFIQFLEKEGMLCVIMDEQGEWYRYHHLFQELLQRQLKARLTPDEIAGLHRRAASWFEGEGLLEEAIQHLLQADEPAEAGRLIVRHRNDILNGEQWHRLDQWLQQLPAEVTEDDPELLMLKAWRLQNQGCHEEAFPVLDRIEALTSSTPSGPAVSERLRGSINALRGYQYYNKGQADLTLKCAKQALSQLPPDCLSERGYAMIVMAGALRISGDPQGARKVIYDALADTSVPMGTFQCRLLRALCVVNWTTANLPEMRLAAKRSVEMGEELGLPECVMNARYFLGSVQYHQNELSQAETSLVAVVTARRAPNQQYFTESAFALASVYQARGQTDKARETVESVCEHLLGIPNMAMLQCAQAYQADLALRQGRVAEAVNWAQSFDPEPFQNMYLFHEPRMTLARVLIAQGSADSHRQADRLLTRLEAFVAGTHNIRFQIEVFALQALLHAARGDEAAARAVLGRAVSLALPGGFIRLFVDLGPGLARLLKRLELDAEGQHYVGRILNAFPGDGQTKADAAPDHPLTKRELEILSLLANELSNKQISVQLSISPSTVKRHTENIYHKLAVPDRHQAVAKATGLAIIRSH